jgi:predicted ATPase
VTAKDEKTHPFMETMQLMDIEGLHQRIELNRLPEECTKNFFSIRLGAIEFDDEFIHRFYQETDGNPLFMTELLKYLIEFKIIAQDNGTWKPVKKLKEVKIPKQIYNVILRRLERLGKEDRVVLDYASVIGDMFTSLLLSRALGVDRIKLLGQLGALEKTHKLIYPQNGNYKFDHSKIKEVLYGELSEDMRIKYHSIIACALEDLNKKNLDEVTEDLAFHYYNCKNKDKALYYLLQAAERARLDYSLDEAITFYSRALELEKNHKKRREILNGLKIVYDMKGKLKNNNT